MKKLLVLLLACVMVYNVQAQSKSEKSLKNAVKALTKAMIDADSVALDKLTAKELSYGHSGGKLETKIAFIENFMNGNSDFTSIDLTDQSITTKGKTGIVRHVLSGSTNDKGKPAGTVKLHVILVWVKENNTWKLIARQAVKYL